MTMVTTNPSDIHSLGTTLVTEPCESPAASATQKPSSRVRERVLFVALAAIHWYQRQREGMLSPCRFFPSCSVYAHDALTDHGLGRGSWLIVRRLSRCRPFGPSGFDPVPQRLQSSTDGHITCHQCSQLSNLSHPKEQAHNV